MHKIRRVAATAVMAAAVIVGLAGPALAVPTVRALWDMSAVPTMVDSAGGDNNGKTSNITMSGGFYAFNGTTSIATVPHNANLTPGTANVRLDVRINTAQPPANGESYDILRKGTSSTAGGYYKIELRGKSGGGMNAACIFKDKNNVVGTAITSVPSGQWVTISCAKTATTVTLVVNGATRTTASRVGAITNTAGVYLGGKGDGTDVFSGLMDYAKITIG